MNFQPDRQRKPSQSTFLSTRRDSTLRSNSTGQALDPAMRQEMEQRFNYNFSQVRIHSSDEADAPALAGGARAYTQGRDIVFRNNEYAPHSMPGQTLLAHELAHVVQQNQPGSESSSLSPEQEARRAAHQVASGNTASISNRVPTGLLQRDDGVEEDRFRLRMPQLGESLGYRPRPLTLGQPGEHQLRLDPQIQAQIEVIRLMRRQLSIENLTAAVSQIGTAFPTTQPGITAPVLTPSAAAQAASSLPGSNIFSTPSLRQQQPFVPAGSGPGTPREASVSDILEAFLHIPAVQQGVNRLQEQASATIRRDWSQLSGGERALLITQGVIMGAGALTAVGLNTEARQFVLDQIQDRDIPLPGLPVTFRFNVTGENRQLMIGVNVGELLPSSWGFH